MVLDPHPCCSGEGGSGCCGAFIGFCFPPFPCLPLLCSPFGLFLSCHSILSLVHLMVFCGGQLIEAVPCLSLLMFLCLALTRGCSLQRGFMLAFPSPHTHDSKMKMSGIHRFSAETVSLLRLTHSSGFQLIKGLSHIYSQGSGKQR